MSTSHGFEAALAAASAFLALSCSSGDDAASPGGNDGGGGAAAVSPLEFSPCPLVVTQPYTTPPTGPLSAGGYDGGPSVIGTWLAYASGNAAMSAAMGECATARMPAVWEEPEGDAIDVFVKRYPAAEQPARGQLWLLQGGPGVATSTLEYMAFLVAARLPTLDIYLPDHRGTGNSTLAACPEGTVREACVAAIPHLDGLTATGGARDLAALIDATRVGAQPVFVYGLSYGTYWAQRYLQVRPEQPTAVILDSVVPVGMDYADFDTNYDATARAVLRLCQADATCSAKLGPDPIARAAEAIAVARPGPCNGGTVRRHISNATGGDAFDRLLLPPGVYRALRCNPADEAWFETVRAYHAWYEQRIGAGFSQVLQNNIVVSELLHSGKTAEELWAEGATLIAAVGGPTLWADAATYWPKYPRDAHHGQWPSTSAPILVLQGNLDPRTPYGDIVKAAYSGEHQHYVEMPLATHFLADSLNAPMADLTAPGCGFQVMESFLADPSRRPDTSCIAGMMPVDWASPPPEWMALVGIEDLWENP